MLELCVLSKGTFKFSLQFFYKLLGGQWAGWMTDRQVTGERWNNSHKNVSGQDCQYYSSNDCRVLLLWWMICLAAGEMESQVNLVTEAVPMMNQRHRRRIKRRQNKEDSQIHDILNCFHLFLQLFAAKKGANEPVHRPAKNQMADKQS